MVYAGMLLALVLVSYLIYNGKRLLKNLKVEWIVFGLILIELFIVYGGTVFNAIRGTPWYYVKHETGGLNWIIPEMRSQFAMEGYIIATLSLFLS